MFAVGDVFSITQRDSTKTLIQKTKDQIRLQTARHHYLQGAYNAALEIYEELYFDDMDNPELCYRLGQCHYSLLDYQSAVKLFGKSIDLDSIGRDDVHFRFGKALHSTEKIEEALVQYELHRATIIDQKPKKYIEIDRYIASAKYAIKAINNPVSIEVKNAGTSVNSAFDDYGPSVSADQKTLIFTSRRPDTKGGLIDVDGKYFEDILISTWDKDLNIWGKAEGIKGRLNTEYHDGCLSISPDGRYIYVYRNYGENGSGEIYVSKMSSSGKWGATKSVLEVNTTYWESSASLTGDGKTMYYTSEKKGGLGRGDVYMVKKISRKEWSEPVSLGGVINTPYDEKMVYIHPDGNVMFISSNGHTGIGSYDIFISVMVDSVWQKPVNLGYPINTVGDDVNFVLTKDNKTAYYSGNRSNTMGGTDIYTVDVSNWSLIQNIGKMMVSINGSVTASDTLAIRSRITITDKKTGFLVEQLKTDNKGKFSVRLLADKVYIMKVRGAGPYAEYEEELNIVGGGYTQEKKIALKPR